MPDAIMIFAAGFGTRMGHLTKDRPKPMIPVAGRPLIDHALDLTDAVAPLRIVANTHYLPDMLEAHLTTRGISISREAPQILDTGGGLKAALPLLQADPVFTLNSDVVWSGPNPLQLLHDAWDPDRMDALLMCIPVTQAIGRKGGGDFSADADGRISRGGNLIYAGVQIIRSGIVAEWPDRVFSLNAVWDELHRRDRLFSLRYPGAWCDVGHPEGIELAEALIRDRDV
ncbi:MAG: nucleotidyltransferase family protein [Pseudomonadota bacterium]